MVELPYALIFALIAFMACVIQWVSWWAKLPAILFLLIGGIVFGPVLGVINPDQLFGDLLFPLISLSVAIILFEGSLTLRFDEIKKLQKVVRSLVTIGVLVTWSIVAVTVHFAFSLGWGISILFGALTSVTGPTVIVPLLRSVRANRNITQILRWEGIVIDPIGALLSVVVFEFILHAAEGGAIGYSTWVFFEVIIIGSMLGAAGGWLLGLLLKHHVFPEYLHNLMTLSAVLLVFTVSNFLAHEAGLLAVTVMGMWLANTKDVHIDEILDFKENLTILLVSGLFILLAARIDLTLLLSLGAPVLLLLFVVQFIARPLSVWASTIGSELKWQEKMMLSWIAPRGIVAAAVSAAFAIRLSEAEVPGADLLVPLTFLVIIGTVVIQSVTSRFIARLLKVSDAAPRGFLIIGANPVAQAIGQMLKDLDFHVTLVDSNWEYIRSARMKGIPTFYGNPVSEHADRHLELVGIGKLLALSPRRNLNILSTMRYKTEFGKQNIYTIPTKEDGQVTKPHQILIKHGYTLFSGTLNYGKFASLLSRGAEIKKTKLTETYSYDDFLVDNARHGYVLAALSPQGRIEFFVEAGNFKPSAGWSVISLSQP